jgi:2-polyprenyl-6-methoxyphenol hydroxylase-like FAD-dependent oxidoreductase
MVEVPTGGAVDDADVVIVGGGIAGASLAHALASEGKHVAVLESSVEFEDRVRGEQMHAWGVKEARDLGVEQVLLDAGAHVAGVWRQYIEGAPEPVEVPVSMMVAGVNGTLNMRHPDACRVLLDAASGAGAEVHRGIRDVTLTPEQDVTISFVEEGTDHRVRTPLVVGADGRGSTVRRQTGIELSKDEAVNYVAGLLLDDLDVPDDFDALVAEGDVLFLLFHQGHRRARAYVVVGASDRHRFAGREAKDRFLEAATLKTFPWEAGVTHGTPAGPCATYPGDDTWTDRPFADGVVLIGDAAGWNDPIIGQGLSIAMRDARIVRDLVLGGATKAADFLAYGDERVERMRRVRLLADIMTVTYVEPADNRPARRSWVGERLAALDPDVFQLFAGILAGPETVPTELVDPVILDRIRGA